MACLFLAPLIYRGVKCLDVGTPFETSPPRVDDRTIARGRIMLEKLVYAVAGFVVKSIHSAGDRHP